ncbi:hypothetical protein ACJJTC_016579 [Scirpophaga incertulas]
MDTRKVYYHSLLRDELVYEVNIRAETPEDTVDKLRKQLKKICTDFSPDEIMDEELKPSVELPIITEKVKELQNILENFRRSRERHQLTRAKALYCHLTHRLDRLMCQEAVDLEIKSSLRQKLNSCYATLETVTTKKQDGESSTSSIPEDVVVAGWRKNWFVLSMVKRVIQFYLALSVIREKHQKTSLAEPQ